jgi:hypothetical protein
LIIGFFFTVLGAGICTVGVVFGRLGLWIAPRRAAPEPEPEAAEPALAPVTLTLVTTPPPAEPQAEPADAGEKPPPIVLYPNGIPPKPVNGAVKYDWMRIIAKPLFQVFVESRAPIPHTVQSDVWAAKYVEERILADGEDALWDEFNAWQNPPPAERG